MSIYVHRNGRQEGPYTTDEIQTRIANATLSGEDLAWVEGAQDWRPINQVVRHPTPKQSKGPSALATIATAVMVLWGVGAAVTTFVPSGLSSLKPQQVKISVSDLEAGWVGFSGTPYYPQVSVTVHNTGDSDIRFTQLRAVFVDEKGVITSESQSSIINLPSGRSKGPVTLKGTIGFQNEIALYPMLDDKEARWHFELYKDAGPGNWVKIESGPLIPDGARDEGR